MVARYCDGFGTYSSAQISRNWNTIIGSPSIDATGGIESTPCLRLDNWGYGVEKILDSQSEWIVGLMVHGLPDSERPLVYFINGGTVQCYVTLLPSGAVAAYKGDATLHGISAGNLVVATRYSHIEIYANIDVGIAGNLKIYVDEVLALDAHGSTSMSIFPLTADTIRICGGPFHTKQVDIDDVIILDGTGAVNNAISGAKHVIDTIRPNAIGAHEEWFGSGDNYLLVDDVAADDNTTSIGAFHEATDTYNFEDIEDGDIAFVQERIVAKHTQDCDRTIEAVARVDGTDFFGASQVITSSYYSYTEIFEVNPDTSNAWTPAEVNSSEFGVHHLEPVVDA